MRKTEWLPIVGLLFLGLVPAIGGVVRLSGLAAGGAITADNARFFAAPLPVVLHIVGALFYSLVGAFQFSPTIRRRHPAWHRRTGRALGGAGLVVALSGLWMNQFYLLPPHDGALLYAFRLAFGMLMALSLVLGVMAARNRDFLSHSAWMLRAYAIGLGAGTQVFTHLPWFILVGPEPPEGPRAVMMGAGWIINLAFAEWLIRRRGRRTRRELALPAG